MAEISTQTWQKECIGWNGDLVLILFRTFRNISHPSIVSWRTHTPLDYGGWLMITIAACFSVLASSTAFFSLCLVYSVCSLLPRCPGREMGRERGRSGSVKLKGSDGRSSYMERITFFSVFSHHITQPPPLLIMIFLFSKINNTWTCKILQTNKPNQTKISAMPGLPASLHASCLFL